MQESAKRTKNPSIKPFYRSEWHQFSLVFGCRNQNSALCILSENPFSVLNESNSQPVIKNSHRNPQFFFRNAQDIFTLHSGLIYITGGDGGFESSSHFRWALGDVAQFFHDLNFGLHYSANGDGGFESGSRLDRVLGDVARIFDLMRNEQRSPVISNSLAIFLPIDVCSCVWLRQYHCIYRSLDMVDCSHASTAPIFILQIPLRSENGRCGFWPHPVLRPLHRAKPGGASSN